MTELKYNSLQWRETFEGQLGLLRPHLSVRVLDAMSLQAWNEFGTKDVDPVKAAKTCSAELDKVN